MHRIARFQEKAPHLAIVADRQTNRHGAPYTTLHVCVDHRLAGHGNATNGSLELFPVAGLIHLEHGRELVTRPVPHPAQGDRLAPTHAEKSRVRYDWSERRFADRHLAIRPPADADVLLAVGDFSRRQIRNIVEVAARRVQVRAAPGDPRISANGDKRKAGRHQTNRVVRWRFVAGNHPWTWQMNTKMGIVCHERAAACAARFGHRDGIAGPAKYQFEEAKLAAVASGTHQIRSRRFRALREPAPEPRPILSPP